MFIIGKTVEERLKRVFEDDYQSRPVKVKKFIYSVVKFSGLKSPAMNLVLVEILGFLELRCARCARWTENPEVNVRLISVPHYRLPY